MTHKLEVTEDNIPAFQKAGTIVPRRDRFRRSSIQMVNDPYTLVIALNGSKAAEGELYIDDGKSFEFERGAYIHRRFVFSDGKLVSSNIASLPAPGKTFSTDCVIKRIVLLGLSNGKKGAVIEPGNHRIDIESGPLKLRGRKGPIFLTIRKPNV